MSAEEAIEKVFHSVLSTQLKDHLNNVFNHFSYSSNELITEAGRVEKHFFITLSGVQMLYLINSKGEKVILGFTYESNPSGVYDSFITQKSSRTFLEAITPTKMIGISLKEYRRIFELFPECYPWRANFIEQILFGRVQREVELTTQTAKERFDTFMARCPKELMQIPQKHLASYLNMKPETFSRLRGMRA